VLRRALILGLVLVAGCGSEDEAACTAIGCDDGVIVTLPRYEGDVSVRICAGDRCEIARGQGSIGWMSVQMPVEGRTADVTVTVRDGAGVVVARGRGTAPVTINQPNGPNCPPTCRQVLVTLRGTALVPTPG